MRHIYNISTLDDRIICFIYTGKKVFSSIFSPVGRFPPWEFTVDASRKKCGAAFLSASPQCEGVWFHSGLSSARPVKCCRASEPEVLENTTATLRHQFPFLSPKRDVRGSVAETKRMTKFFTALK